MKHKGQYTTPQLKRLKAKGHDVFPVFGRPQGMTSLRHSPRSKFDPKPWVWGSHADGLRYSAWELTTEPHKATPGELADQRHEVEDTIEFVRINLKCAPQGVAA
ncbi:hypothetical protein SEA_GALACTICA_33 [Streptomyces phage Galactica]|nr:hypothetical protein SEA_GALACTICA_33 [Streptomyces phage Galactica]